MGKYLLLLIVLSGANSLWADQACEEQCNLDYWACSDNCGAFGGALCEQQCVNAQNSCLQHCNQCPSTRDYTTRTILNNQATGRNGCYEDHMYFYSGKRYAEYSTTQRLDNYRETTACNGTKTTTLLSSTTSSYKCWARDAIASCSPYSPNFLRICQ
jgi:hypothetical protein